MTSRSRPPWGPCRATHGKPNTFSSYTTRRDTAGAYTMFKRLARTRLNIRDSGSGEPR